jgi:hypothetical protein
VPQTANNNQQYTLLTLLVEGVDAILVNAIHASPCLLDSLNVKEQKVRDAKAQTTISNSVVYLPCFCGGRQPVKVAVDLPNLPL